MKFTEFSLHEDLLKGIAKAGYETCTPVQEQVIKTALNKQDLYVQSQTGTGKTAAYLITIIQEMLTQTTEELKQALIMVPTRELAVQVEEEARTLLSGSKLSAGSFYGGVGYGRQIEMLKNGVNILIGTPGRVIDLNESNQMKLDKIAYLVIDEADRMFDMGFYPDLRKLIKVLPLAAHRQTMLFSATLNTYVKNLAWEYTVDAQEIEIESNNITVDEINQKLFHVPSDDKMRLLLGIIEKEKPESFIVFCNTKRSCEVVAKRMKLNGIECEFIIGDLPQSKRLQVLDSFKRSSLKCLVATDVAARGIDIDDLSMVINYDLPNEAENYVHRIGRTARAGKTGSAYTFCSEQDVYNLPAIERYVGSDIPSQVANEDMYAEDKSAGTYIRTGNFRDDRHGERDSRNRGRGNYNRNNSSSNNSKYNRNRNSESKSSRYNSKSGAQDKDSNRTGEQNRTSDRYQKRRNETRNDYRKNENKQNSFNTNRNTRKETTQDMSQMSFEERMKLYKEKYSKSSPTMQNRTQNTKRSNNNKSGKKSYQKKNYSTGKNGEKNIRKNNNTENRTENKNNNHTSDKNYSNKRNYRNKSDAYTKSVKSQTKSQPSVKVSETKKVKKQKPPRKGVGNIFTRMFSGRR